MVSVVEAWGTALVGGWPEWIDEPLRVGDRLAAGVLGARPGEVVVADSVTVNLYKLAGAALAAAPPERRVVVADAADFPTDRYVLEGVAAAAGSRVAWLSADPVAGPDARLVAGACAAHPGQVALVALSLVAYRSGALADLPAITAAAHDAGALCLWDLSHAAGAVSVDLEAGGADLAVGCTYKYLNGGPGAPAFLYVRRPHQAALVSPIRGWFGQHDQFAMDAPWRPADGIARFQAGTPSILALAAVDEGVALAAEAGPPALEAKGRSLTALFVALADADLAGRGFALGSPRDPARRGAHVSLRHPDAWRICRALAGADLVADFRPPDSIRFGFPALYTSHVDVWDVAARIAEVVAAGRHESFDVAHTRVT